MLKYPARPCPPFYIVLANRRISARMEIKNICHQITFVWFTYIAGHKFMCIPRGWSHSSSCRAELSCILLHGRCCHLRCDIARRRRLIISFFSHWLTDWGLANTRTNFSTFAVEWMPDLPGAFGSWLLLRIIAFFLTAKQKQRWANAHQHDIIITEAYHMCGEKKSFMNEREMMICLRN